MDIKQASKELSSRQQGNLMKLSIVVPAYNERNRIKPTLVDYVNYFSKKYEFELIVVLNGCTDGTKDLVENFAKEHPELRWWSFPRRLGKAGAIIEGFKVADGDMIGFVDADKSVSAEEFNKLVTALQNYDGAIASRWLPDSNTMINETRRRKFARWGYRLLVRLLFGLSFKDTQCGAKVFKGHVVKDEVLKLSNVGADVDIDLLYRTTKKGYRIQEVPITWLYHMETRLKLKDIIIPMFLALVRLRIVNSPLRVLLPHFGEG